MAGTSWNGTFYLIERHKIGTAIGLQGSSLSFALMTVPVIFGWLSDNSIERQNGYYDPILMCCGISGLAIIVNLWNYLYDRLYNESILALDV